MGDNRIDGAPRVLVADTEELLCRMMARSLDRAGYSCDLALDGPKALEVIRRVSYDLIIAASCVRTWGDLDLICEARREGRNASTPIVVISCQECDPFQWADDGPPIQGYLTKPFSLEQLKEVVSRVLDLSRGRAES